MGLFGSSHGDLLPHLQRIEAKLDTLLASLGLTASTGPAPGEHPRMAEVRALAAAGRKIEAIKIHREITGLGLKESKDAIDAM